jgi:hypothetical protein
MGNNGMKITSGYYARSVYIDQRGEGAELWHIYLHGSRILRIQHITSNNVIQGYYSLPAWITI